MVGEWEWEWEWLYGNGREWESERHSRTPLVWDPWRACTSGLFIFPAGFSGLENVLIMV